MLAKFIKQLRLKNHFNQSFVAGHIGVSRPTYLEVEKGDRDLTITEAKKLADLYGLSLDSFLNQEEINVVVKKQEKENHPKTKLEFLFPKTIWKNSNKFYSIFSPKLVVSPI
jgi:transcriptional regulator with XRE-family HTH domain